MSPVMKDIVTDFESALLQEQFEKSFILYI